MTIFPIYKPPGYFSRQTYKKLIEKGLVSKQDKIGHAGTLDPMAHGVLVVLINESLKMQSSLTNCFKTYYCLFVLGIETTANDMTGSIKNITRKRFFVEKHCVESMIEYFNKRKYIQRAPLKSNRKVGGKKLIRKENYGLYSFGWVHLKEIRLISFINNTIEIYINCSTGFFVRALAREIGFFLGQYCTTLSIFRLSVGDYYVSNTIRIY